MAMKGYSLLLCVFLVQLALGDNSDVYYWRQNSNWNNPSNWELGSPPCGKQIASILDNSVIYLKEDVSIQTLMLPENGQIILGANIAVTLSEDASCGDGPGTGLSTESTNEFIGNSAHYWECSDNWLTSDNLPAEHPPCGEDTAVFEENSYFHSVIANETIYVSSLTVRGQNINLANQLDAREFKLNINIVPDCASDPTQCPCPSSGQSCLKPTGVTLAATGMIVGIIMGLVFLLVLAALIVIVIVAVIMYKRKNTVGLYKKDELLDYEDGQSDGKELTAPTPRTFDNPVYESTTIASGDIQLTGYQGNPKLDFQAPAEDSAVTPSDGNYEAVGVGELVGSHDEEFVKVDLEALEVALNVAGPAEDNEVSEDFDSELFEEIGKGKKGKKSKKYGRF